MSILFHLWMKGTDYGQVRCSFWQHNRSHKSIYRYSLVDIFRLKLKVEIWSLLLLFPGLTCKTPRRQNKRKILRNVKSLTPRCQQLYKEYKKTRRQIDYKTRTKRAIDFSKEESFEKLTEKMSPLSKKVMWIEDLNKYKKKLKNKKLQIINYVFVPLLTWTKTK